MAINLTPEGYEKLTKELNYLKTTKRLEIADDLETARLKGDLRENAEYDAAKEAQAHLEKKIAELENTLANGRIINEEDIDPTKAFIGATLTLEDLNRNQTVKYMLVSQEEANFKEKKISVDSPIGKALTGKSVGDSVEVTVPAGVLRYKLLNIER